MESEVDTPVPFKAWLLEFGPSSTFTQESLFHKILATIFLFSSLSFLKNVALKALGGQREVDLHTWYLVQGWASHNGPEEGAGV